MDVRLSAEQAALQESAARLVEDLGPGTVGGLDDSERVAKLDAAVTDAGWRELRSGDGSGAPWASGVEVGVVAEELGRGAADTAFLGPTLAAELRRLAGAPGAESVETVLLSPDLSVLAPAPDTEGALAVDAAGATHALSFAPTDGGWSLVRVPVIDADTPVDLTRSMAGVDAAAAEPVADQPVVLDVDALTRVATLGLAVTCADLVGTMQGALDLAAAYAAERKQYGRPVGAFQAVQHMLADSLVGTEGSRSLALHAAWSVDATSPDEALAAASVAKAYCARAARQVCEAAIQVHGGIGNTWECMAHVHLRRAFLSSDVFGGVDANLDRVLNDRLARA